MKKSMGMRPWLLIIMAALLLAYVAVPAGAGNNDRKLYGDYAASFSLNCATCENNFEFFYGVFPYCADDALSTTYSWNAQGLYTFDGKGTLTFVGRYLAVLNEPFYYAPDKKSKVVLPPKIKCVDGGHYTVNDDLTVNAGFDSCTVYADELGTIPIHIISNVNFKGRLLDRMDGPILLLTDTMESDSPGLPSIEEVYNPPPIPGAPGTTRYRICGMTGTAMPIKGKRMKKGE